MTAALLLALSLLQAEPVATPPASTEAAPSETKPGDATPPDAKPADAKPVDPAAAAAAKPAEAGAADAAPSPATAAEAPPASESQPPTPPPSEPVAEPVAAPKAVAEPAPVAPAPAASASAPAAPEPPPAVDAVASTDLGCPVAPAPPEADPDPDYALIGYSFGIGFPEFGTGSVIVRPLRWLRVGAGVTWNYAGYGVRGEVTFAPLRWYVSPTLNLAVGRYLKMDGTKAGSVPTEIQGLVSKVGYQYVDATLGLELGNQRHGMLVLQVGVTRLSLDAPGTATFDATASGGGSTTTTTIEATGLKVKGYAPAASLSWIIFL
jgi:hypothetical protein